MRSKFLLFFVIVLLFSCGKKKSDKEQSCSADSAKKEYKMYQMSEMSLLMERMYAENKQLKQQILAEEPLGQFPSYFEDIHTARLTDPAENDLFFKEKAKQWILAQRLIYDDNQNARQHFNDMVNACVNCHESKCGGPIVRIKKLYIE